MTNMSAWETVFLAFGSSATMLAILGVLGKSLLDKLITRDMKRFEIELKSKSDSAVERLKFQLKSESDVAMERLKSELQIRTIEHQVRFSRLHEKRAEIIAELYKNLVNALVETESFMAPFQMAGEPDRKDKYKTAWSALVELNIFFNNNRIYLPQQQCRQLDTLINNLRNMLIKNGSFLRQEDSMLTHEQHNKKYETWDASWNEIKTEIATAKASLEDEFRSLLGEKSQ